MRDPESFFRGCEQGLRMHAQLLVDQKPQELPAILDAAFYSLAAALARVLIEAFEPYWRVTQPAENLGRSLHLWWNRIR